MSELPEAHAMQQSSDEELALWAQKGSAAWAQDALLHRYKNRVRAKTRSYFLMGADHEDVVQEGMIGLFKAIRDYSAQRSSSFGAFADLCITRQIITAVKAATRLKHRPLNTYVSLSRTVHEGESEQTLIDTLSAQHTISPEEVCIGRESYARIEKEMRKDLSPLEQEVVAMYLDGVSYQEIAQRIGRSPKSIDNALQRIKRKIDKIMRATLG